MHLHISVVRAARGICRAVAGWRWRAPGTWRLHGTVGLLLLALLAGCAPTQDVRPYPDFIRSAVEPGDRVLILTRDGRSLEFEAEAVDDSGVHGGGSVVAYDEIRRVAVRSWKEIEFPCGTDAPLGCSVPTAVQSVSDLHAQYVGHFHPACVQHDFCYRHGHATYGRTREDCDAEFLANMRASCLEASSPLGKAGQLLSSPECLLAASHMHDAVRRMGAPAYRTDRSTYCEYDGPPSGDE